MAGASATSTRKGGIKAYWKHRGYDRLDAAAQGVRREGAGGDVPVHPGARRRHPSLRRRRAGGRPRPDGDAGRGHGGLTARPPIGRRSARRGRWLVTQFAPLFRRAQHAKCAPV